MGSTMKQIINELESNTSNWITTKTGYKNLNRNYNVGNIVTSIKKVTEKIDIRIDYDNKKGRKNITIVKTPTRIEPWRKEEFLERLICSVNSDLENQIPLNIKNSKENIDLIYKGTELIELKAENGIDSPVFALVELIKNYFLYTKRASIKQLTILAPSDYINSYKLSKNSTAFINIAKSLKDVINKDNEFNGIEKISVKRIHYKLENMLDYIKEYWISNISTDLITETNNTRFKEKIECLNIIDIKNIVKDKSLINSLLYNNWEEIISI